MTPAEEKLLLDAAGKKWPKANYVYIYPGKYSVLVAFDRVFGCRSDFVLTCESHTDLLRAIEAAP